MTIQFIFGALAWVALVISFSSFTDPGLTKREKVAVFAAGTVTCLAFVAVACLNS